MYKALRKLIRKKPTRSGIPQLVKNRTPTIKDINSLMLEVSGFLSPFSIARRSLPRREKMRKIFVRTLESTGEELSAKRKIIVPGSRKPISPRGKNNLTPVWGCSSECLIIQRALKAMEKEHNIKLNPRLIMRRFIHKDLRGKDTNYPHMELLFDLNGKTWRMDPFNETLEQVNEKELKDASPFPARPLTYKELSKAKNNKPFTPLPEPK